MKYTQGSASVLREMRSSTALWRAIGWWTLAVLYIMLIYYQKCCKTVLYISPGRIHRNCTLPEISWNLLKFNQISANFSSLFVVTRKLYIFIHSNTCMTICNCIASATHFSSHVVIAAMLCTHVLTFDMQCVTMTNCINTATPQCTLNKYDACSANCAD